MIPRRFIWLLDALMLALAGPVAYWIASSIHTGIVSGGFRLILPWLSKFDLILSKPPLSPLGEMSWMYFIMLAAVMMVLTLFKDYGRLLYQSRSQIIARCLLAVTWGTGLIALILVFARDRQWSRLFVLSYLVTCILGLVGYRLLVRSYLLRRRHAGDYAKNVLLVGQKTATDWMAHYFEVYVPATSHRLFGCLCPEGSITTVGNGVPWLGHPDELGDLLIHRPVHEVIAIQPLGNGGWMEGVIQSCDYLGVLLRIVPEVLLREQRRLPTLYPFADLHLPAVVLTPPHWDSDALFLKRLIDIVLAALLLLLLSPLIGMIALILKLSERDAPVFYPWHVVGQNGVPFTGYKFRTMVPNADALKADLMQYNEMIGPVFKMKNDPRVTAVGHILRKFSLDELPQLWSVLKGDMSLVGPRPAGPHELVRYEFWHKRKLSIRPGMTCLWQISGRNAIDNFDEWVKMDLEYIDKWSLWLDIRILIRTAWAVVAGTGV